MAFVSGLVLGLVLGIGLVFGSLITAASDPGVVPNWYSPRDHDHIPIPLSFSNPFWRVCRTDAQHVATVAAFARMTMEEAAAGQVVPFLGGLYSAPELTWLNLQLKKIWPYVDAATSELIRASVEPVLEQYKPILMFSLTFSKPTLGTVAPQFTGVEIIDAEKEAGEVIMELELQWDGNPNIELDIRTRVGVGLPVQVKGIGFTGVLG